ncbi:MAG: type VI secretion system protein ImpA [Myxococcota bacterium]|jgi:type VI secretion system protein ImpA
MTWAPDLTGLLQPITETAPTGESLRYDPVYAAIKEARRADDKLPRGVWKQELKESDWRAVARLSKKALQDKSKDLQIAAWLTEGWLHVRGWPGLRYGLELCLRLCETFWDDGLHPNIDGEDLDYRLAPIVWMNTRLAGQLRIIPLVSPSDGRSPVGLYNSQHAAALGRLKKQKPKAYAAAIERGELNQEDVSKSLSMGRPSELRETHAAISGALEMCDALDKLLDERCGAESPSLYAVQETLRAALHIVEKIAMPACNVSLPTAAVEAADLADPDDLDDEDAHTDEQEFEDESAPQDVTTESQPVPVTVPAEKGDASGVWAIRDREHAYELLNEVADYLESIEPHSPTPYLLRRAAGWGGLSLQELLPELVMGPQSLGFVRDLLGVQQPGTADGQVGHDPHGSQLHPGLMPGHSGNMAGEHDSPYDDGDGDGDDQW